MGKVFLVGAGPGDPDLITVKGMKALQQSDVILYDRLVNKGLLTYAPANVELIYCGKRPNDHSLPQETINHLLVKFAKERKKVTRLKGGDPFIFGRGSEEAAYLRRNGISFEIIPGITSGSAAPAYAGIPLTHRGLSASVTFISGVSIRAQDTEKYWEQLAQGIDTLCIYMGVSNLPFIREKLMRYGREASTPIALVQWGTTNRQATITGTLANIMEKANHIQNPAMIIVGEVVRLREQIAWFEQLSIDQEAFPVPVTIE